ncbi:MAG: cellulose-binding protein [Firmicutes bacterium]|nr:cellulose-binding protein [Bacillota bacterium]
MKNSPLRKLLPLSAVLGLAIVGLGPQGFAQDAPVATATVQVSPPPVPQPVPNTAIGMNTAEWDGNLYTPGVPQKLEAMGVQALRWPGGSFADTFDWEQVPFEINMFAQLVHEIHAQAIITVNYGSGTPAEAAAEVRYTDITHHDGFEYWEIGNEQYGDGEYQHVLWEEDYWPNKSPRGYAENSLKFIEAMRKVDPNIKIGIDATIPGVWPSGIKPYWDRTVLPIVAKDINFVIIHWYPENPGQENDARLLQDPAAIPTYMKRLKAYLRQYAGSRANQIQIFVDETNNVSSDPDKQTVSLVNALFLAKDYNDWLKAGAANVSWWDLHNGINITTENPNLYGTANYGDYGILSNGDPGEPPLNTPFPPYYALCLVHAFVQPGDEYLKATSNQQWLAAYAVKTPNANEHFMLVNTSPTLTYHAHIAAGPSLLNHSATLRYYGMDTKTIVTQHISWTGTIAVPPYTVMEISLP